MPCNELGIRCTFKQSLQWFIKQSRNLLRHFASEASSSLIRPYTGNRLRLRQYGFMQHVGCITSQLCLAPEVANVVHAMVCTLKGIRKGKKHIITHAATTRFRFPPHPPWEHMCRSSALHDAVNRVRISIHDNITTRGGGEVTAPRPVVFHLSCPRCKRTQDFAKRRLFNANKWVQLRCKGCRAVTTSSKWQCSCLRSWNVCPSHRTLGFNCVGYRRKNQHTFETSAAKQLRQSAIIRKIGHLGDPNPDRGKHARIHEHRINGGCRSCDVHTVGSNALLSMPPSCTPSHSGPEFSTTDAHPHIRLARKCRHPKALVAHRRHATIYSQVQEQSQSQYSEQSPGQARRCEDIESDIHHQALNHKRNSPTRTPNASEATLKRCFAVQQPAAKQQRFCNSYQVSNCMHIATHTSSPDRVCSIHGITGSWTIDDPCEECITIAEATPLSNG